VDAQRRVRRAASDLGHRPDANARSLRTSSAIRVISDFVASGMFSSLMLAGANQAARAQAMS
jgi:LacI family transcriptional regulator